MNAIEARKLTQEKLNSELPEKEYELVKKGIERNISFGNFRYWSDGKLYESVKERLRSEGFKVSDGFLKDVGGTTISWK